MAMPQAAGAFRSRFGGFWIDRFDADDELRARIADGRVSPELGERLARFMTDGYVIIPGAVPHEITERVRRDIDQMWTSPPDGALVETFRLGRWREVPPDPSLRRSPTKLLDLHAWSEAARTAIAAPPVLELLATVFEASPKAFQSLTFWQGSQQAIHKDTAYVKIADEPMHLAAAWLALEDVEEGTGELQYYVGSHRDPDHLFGGRHKWMTEAPREHLRYLRSLHRDAKRYGHPKQTFLPREGDVLVWHADLAHGGSRIRRKGSTRQSLVTHYCPEHDDPPYARALGLEPHEQDGCLFVAQYGPP